MQVNVVDARVRHTRRFHSSRPKKKVSFFFPFLPRRSLLLHPRLTPFSHFSLHLLIYESSLAPFLTLLVSEHHKLEPTLRNYARVRNFSIIQRLKPISLL